MAKKKHFIVVARDPKVIKNGMDIEGKHISFHGKTAKTITDPGIAEAIEQKYGLSAPKNTVESGQVWTERDEHTDHGVNYHPDSAHHFFFGPTPKLREEWERIFGHGKTNDSSTEADS